ncbi:MAG: DUF5399 family protein [Chlamydiota bacterium]
MSVKPKTIDDLGPEVSLDYINNQKRSGDLPVQEGHFVANSTTVHPHAPYQPTWADFQLRYGTNRHNEPWADFLPPPGYFASLKGLFTYQLIPSMGGAEKQEMLLEKLERMRKRKKKKKEQSEKPFSMDDKEEEGERSAIENLLLLLQKLDKDLQLVNMLRNQYHKG